MRGSLVAAPSSHVVGTAVFDRSPSFTVLWLQAKQHSTNASVFQDNDYTMSLIKAGLETLESHRDQLTERFFQRSVLPEMSCLHYLLPDKRDPSVTDRLRHPRNFET